MSHKENLKRTDTFANVRLTQISLLPDEFDVRSERDPEALTDMAGSIRRRGVLQAVTLRRNKGKLELVAGKTRFLSAKSARQEKIPARILTDISDVEAFLLTILENLHQQRFAVLDEAQAYKSLQQRFGLSIDEIARELSKKPAHIEKRLSLLSLPNFAQAAIRSGKLHARQGFDLAKLPDPVEQAAVARKALRDGLNSAETKAVVQEILAEKQRTISRPKKPRPVRQPSSISEGVIDRQTSVFTLRGQTLLKGLEDMAVGYWRVGKLVRLRNNLRGLLSGLQAMQQKVAVAISARETEAKSRK